MINTLICPEMSDTTTTSVVVANARSKTEAYLPKIDANRNKALAITDLEGAVPYNKKYVGT